MTSQPVPVSFYHGETGLVIPFVETDHSIDIGRVGPYSGAFPGSENPIAQASYINEWSDFLRRTREKPCTVRLPPRSHFPEILDFNSNALQQLGFVPQIVETNQTIRLGQPNQNFNRNRRRDLKRSQELGLTFGVETLEKAHEVVSKNRVQRGFPVTLSARELGNLHSTHPSGLLCYSVALDGIAQAAAICFRVNRDLAYVFMWGHDPHGSEPGASMAMLASQITLEMTGYGHKLLCLGTSSLEGEINQGLHKFKDSLGAFSEDKTTYSLLH